MLRNRHTAVSLLFIQIFFYAQKSVASEPSFERLLQMDIGELSQITVTVASKREEKMLDAPGILSVVTAQDIKRYGAKNLKDILNRVPSIQGVGSHFYPHLVSMRGQMIGHNNSDILFLINGRPYRTSWNGGTPYRLLLSFPIELIQRIEIIRGPGSVLYGTGAFTGVIDIITKPAQPENNSLVSVTAGSMSSSGVTLSSGAATEEWNVVAGLRTFKTDGWNFEITDEVNVTDSLDTKEDNTGIMLSTEIGGFSFNILSTSVELNNIGGPPRWPASEQDAEHLMIDIGAKFKLDAYWQSENHLTLNQFDYSFLNNNLLEQERDSDDLLFETTLKGKFGENFDIVLGGTYEDIEGTISSTFDYASYRYSAYSQIDYRPDESQHFNLGFQVNKVQSTDSDFSPRFGYVAHFNPHIGVKLLQSQAFRSAVATERFLPPGNAVIGNPSLDPEKIRTSEAQIFFTANDSFAALTVFKSSIFDVIDRAGSPLQFVNLPGDIESKGVELESQVRFTRSINGIGSVTYQKNEHADGGAATLAPNWMAKLGFDYTSHRGFVLSIFDSYFAEPMPTSDFNPATLNVNPDPDAYHLVTAKAMWNIKQWSGRATMPDLTLSLFIDNLLDEEIYYPEINRKRINSIPLYSERAYYATAEWRL